MKISISKSLTCFALFCSVLYLQGCGDSNVRAVKNGVLNAHPDAQIGPVFKANFSDIRWTSSKENGKNCVRFTGKISKATHEKLAKSLNMQEPIVIMTFSQLYGDLYKKGDEKVTKQFQAEANSLDKQIADLEALKDDLSSQISKIEDKQSYFKNQFSEREYATKYREGEIKRTKEEFEKRKIDFQHYKNTNNEADMKRYLDNAEAEYKDALKQIEITRGKNAKLQEEYKEWEAQKNEAKIEELRKKLATAHDETEVALHRKIDDMRERQEKERIKTRKSVDAEIITKYYWPEGEAVEIEFVVHPEGNIEVKEMKCESWSKLGLTLADVLNAIYQ